MRILIVGAGIGGMTLAALLDRRGERPDLVERAPDLEHAGYMLGLYSLGYRVLRGLGLYERFAAASVPADEYEVFDGDGENQALVDGAVHRPVRAGPQLYPAAADRAALGPDSAR